MKTAAVLNWLRLFLAGVCLHVAPVWGASCSFSLSPSGVSVGSGGGGGNITVTMTQGNNCGWTTAATNAWVLAAGSGTGSGMASYSVESNPNPAPRQTTLTVAGKPFTITQAGTPVTLAGALDAPSLTWLTSSTYPWIGTNSPHPTFDGLHSATSSNVAQNDTQSWLETTVIGPGTIRFWWRVDSDVTPPPPDIPWSWDSLQFLIDGEVMDEILGQIEWCYRSYLLPAGPHVLKWTFVKDAQYGWGADRAWLDRVSYVTSPPDPLQEALNTCGVTWTTGGNTNPTFWASEPGSGRTGGAAARSGAITHMQQSSIQTSIAGVTNVSFWWKVSSEANADYLEFLTNGVVAGRISGETGWSSNYFRLNPGTNSLTWRYVKNSFDLGAKGADAGWVDEVRFNPVPPPSPYRLIGTTRLEDGRVRVTLEGESGCPCEVQASSNLIHWQSVSNLTTTGTLTPVIDETTSATNTARFYRVRSLP